MPAPKRPNTAAATEAAAAGAVRRGQETMAAKLREAGWRAIPPEQAAEVEANSPVEGMETMSTTEASTIIRGYVLVEPLDKEPPGPFVPRGERKEILRVALRGVKRGDYDDRIIDWLSNLDDSTIRTIVSLLERTREAGRTGV